MVKLKVEWTPEAIETLKDTLDFYSIISSKDVVKKRKYEIVGRANELKQFPKLGPIEESEAVEGLDCRYLVQGHCKIIYKVETSKVVILKVFDSRQRPDKMSI